MNELKTRYIVIKLILDKGQFPGSSAEGEPGSNIKIIRGSSSNDSGQVNGLTINVNITKDTGFQNCSAAVTIYGMLIEDVNAFSRINITDRLLIVENRMQIYAGYNLDDDGMPPIIYDGQIRMAGPDFNDPNRPFRIISIMGLLDQNKLADPTNPKGDMSLDNLFKSIISKGPGWVYKPNLIKDETISNPNYTGSVMEQIQKACADHGYQSRLDGNNMLISPIGQPFNSNIYTLNYKNGMLGYPIVQEFGIGVRMWFDPVVQFGQQVKIESTLLDLANGNWFINGMTITLQNRGPKWENQLSLNPYYFGIPS